jgi:hypothetical protein
VLFAGVVLGMLAALNLIYGIAAVANSSFFVGDAKFMLSGLNTWGWMLIFVGAAQGLTAFGVWARWTGVRWVGVAIAVLNAILQMIAMPLYPFWSLCLIALDVLVIYGLIAHGVAAGRDAASPAMTEPAAGTGNSEGQALSALGSARRASAETGPNRSRTAPIVAAVAAQSAPTSNPA